jgi:tRNA(Ile)-lysidine synthase
MTMLRRVAELVRRQGMFCPGERVVVGVSGGADSVALLRALLLLPGLELSPVVAHVNHGLRGESADRDELFVRQLAEELGLPWELERADVAAVARQRGLSLEEAGREVRYAFFRRLQDRYGARSVAVAHTADDQAETVLMRLLRGAGPAGVAGMEPVAPNGVVRPLLDCSRDEVIAFLRALGQEWCEDESNEDQSFLRNRVRHGIIPLLEEINPRVRRALCRFGRLAADDESSLAKLADHEYGRLAVVAPGRVRLPVIHLLNLSPSLRFRVIRRALREVRGNLRRISLSHIEAVANLMSGERDNASVTLPGAVIVREYGDVVIARERSAGIDMEVTVTGPGEYLLADGFLLRVAAGATPEQPPNERLVIAIDGEAAPFPWQVRPFKPGDRLYLAGLGGHKKVKKLFMEERLPLDRRRRIPLLVCGDSIIWVCGLRRGDTARPTGSSGHILRLEYISM